MISYASLGIALAMLLYFLVRKQELSEITKVIHFVVFVVGVIIGGISVAPFLISYWMIFGYKKCLSNLKYLHYAVELCFLMFCVCATIGCYIYIILSLKHPEIISAMVAAQIFFAIALKLKQK